VTVAQRNALNYVEFFGYIIYVDVNWTELLERYFPVAEFRIGDAGPSCSMRTSSLTFQITVVTICTTRFNITNLCIFVAQCSCASRKILTINIYYFPKHDLPNGLDKG